MAEPDRRSPLLHSYENAAVIVSGIAVDQVSRPTICPGYDVAGLVDHIVEAASRAAALGRGQAPPAGDDSPHVELSDAPAQLRRSKPSTATWWNPDRRSAPRCRHLPAPTTGNASLPSWDATPEHRWANAGLAGPARSGRALA